MIPFERVSLERIAIYEKMHPPRAHGRKKRPMIFKTFPDTAQQLLSTSYVSEYCEGRRLLIEARLASMFWGSTNWKEAGIISEEEFWSS